MEAKEAREQGLAFRNPNISNIMEFNISDIRASIIANNKESNMPNTKEPNVSIFEQQNICQHCCQSHQLGILVNKLTYNKIAILSCICWLWLTT